MSTVSTIFFDESRPRGCSTCDQLSGHAKASIKLLEEGRLKPFMLTELLRALTTHSSSLHEQLSVGETAVKLSSYFGDDGCSSSVMVDSACQTDQPVGVAPATLATAACQTDRPDEVAPATSADPASTVALSSANVASQTDASGDANLAAMLFELERHTVRLTVHNRMLRLTTTRLQDHSTALETALKAKYFNDIKSHDFFGKDQGDFYHNLLDAFEDVDATLCHYLHPPGLKFKRAPSGYRDSHLWKVMPLAKRLTQKDTPASSEEAVRNRVLRDDSNLTAQAEALKRRCIDPAALPSGRLIDLTTKSNEPVVVVQTTGSWDDMTRVVEYPPDIPYSELLASCQPFDSLILQSRLSPCQLRRRPMTRSSVDLPRLAAGPIDLDPGSDSTVLFSSSDCSPHSNGEDSLPMTSPPISLDTATSFRSEPSSGEYRLSGGLSSLEFDYNLEHQSDGGSGPIPSPQVSPTPPSRRPRSMPYSTPSASSAGSDTDWAFLDSDDSLPRPPRKRSRKSRPKVSARLRKSVKTFLASSKSNATIPTQLSKVDEPVDVVTLLDPKPGMFSKSIPAEECVTLSRVAGTYVLGHPEYFRGHPLFTPQATLGEWAKDDQSLYWRTDAMLGLIIQAKPWRNLAKTWPQPVTFSIYDPAFTQLWSLILDEVTKKAEWLWWRHHSLFFRNTRIFSSATRDYVARRKSVCSMPGRLFRSVYIHVAELIHRNICDPTILEDVCFPRISRTLVYFEPPPNTRTFAELQASMASEDSRHPWRMYYTDPTTIHKHPFFDDLSVVQQVYKFTHGSVLRRLNSQGKAVYPPKSFPTWSPVNSGHEDI